MDRGKAAHKAHNSSVVPSLLFYNPSNLPSVAPPARPPRGSALSSSAVVGLGPEIEDMTVRRLPCPQRTTTHMPHHRSTRNQHGNSKSTIQTEQNKTTGAGIDQTITVACANRPTILLDSCCCCCYCCGFFAFSPPFLLLSSLLLLPAAPINCAFCLSGEPPLGPWLARFFFCCFLNIFSSCLGIPLSCPTTAASSPSFPSCRCLRLRFFSLFTCASPAAAAAASAPPPPPFRDSVGG